MEPLDSTLVSLLRTMAARGEQPSAMLYTIIARLALKTTAVMLTADRVLLVDYFTAAFCFSEGQGYPIFGWFPNAQGELKDADIDRIMSKRIRQTQADWEGRSSPKPHLP